MKARLAIAFGSALVSPPAFAGELALEGQVGYGHLTHARQSASAVFDGSAGNLTLGGGVQYRVPRGLYFSAWARYFEMDGERVFLSGPGGPVFRLGHPLSLRLVPIQFSVGYSFSQGKAVRPYAAAGGGIVLRREQSTVGGITDSDSREKASGHLLGGLEFRRGRLRFAVEASYITIPDSLGSGGVSRIYGESNLGGFSVVGKIMVPVARGGE